MPRLLIAASGTGGHIFPALSVAEALPNHWSVTWLGVANRLESKLIPKHFQLIRLKVGGLQGNWLRKIIRLIELVISIRTVRQIIVDQRIDIIFTTGGYIAAPAILGGSLCGIPVVLHDSNAIPGRVTRLLGRFCRVVAIGIPTAKHFLSHCKPIFTGTPVRAEFLTPQALPHWVPPGKGPIIVVMGGSQGAIGLNRMVRRIFPLLLSNGCRVIHLTGNNDEEACQFAHPNLIEKPFANEIPGLLQNADLAISRAGAGSLSELAICGTPAILIPFPDAADQHQEANARFAAAHGAAVIVHQHNPEDRTLNNCVWRLIKPRINKLEINMDPLLEMKECMKNLSVNNPEGQLIELLLMVR